MSKRWIVKATVIAVLALALAASAGVWIVGAALTHPARAVIGAPPADFPARDVLIRSSSGALVHGWFAQGSGRGAVLLLHGVRANRLSMLDRARFLRDAGYSVMLIDFQASGESSGNAITFGYLESRDAVAALAELRRLAPDERVGIVGTSMGGAAALLADPPLDADAMVLEQVYPTLSQALNDRMELHAGVMGRWLAPLLAATVKPRLGVSMEQMRPIDRISQIRVPKLLIVGDADRHMRIAESIAMYRAAAEPKALWVIHGAAHVDLCRYGGKEYQARLLAFLGHWLRPSS